MATVPYAICQMKKITIEEYTDNLKGQIFCPGGHLLKAVRPLVKKHYFSHHAGCACDWKRSGMTPWHANWQKICLVDHTEKRIVKDDRLHIADILTPEGKVIELQHSYISDADIREREEFYGELSWLLDMSDKKISVLGLLNESWGVYSVNAKRPSFTKQCYYDVGGYIIDVIKWKTFTYTAGGYSHDGHRFMGRILSYRTFIDRELSSVVIKDLPVWVTDEHSSLDSLPKHLNYRVNIDPNGQTVECTDYSLAVLLSGMYIKVIFEGVESGDVECIRCHSYRYISFNSSHNDKCTDCSESSRCLLGGKPYCLKHITIKQKNWICVHCHDRQVNSSKSSSKIYGSYLL
jgi:hypothetical protein